MKRLSNHILSLLAALLMVALPSRAQIVYECDFENAAERAQWVRVNQSAGTSPVPCPNKWYIGEPGNFSSTGANGLYISADADSATASYVSAATASAVVSYREMNLPVGTYDLRFDWRALGKGSSVALKVAWVPQSVATASNPKGAVKSWVTTYQVGNDLRGQKAWKPEHMTFNVTAADTLGKLVFTWSVAKDDAKGPAACVDNIMISVRSTCANPSAVQYNKTTGVLTWNGNAGLYEVRDYCANAGSLIEYPNISANQLKLTLTSEGTHQFYVRSVCDAENGSYSDWISTSTFVWIPGARCIDYLNIGTSLNSAGVCYTGNFSDFIVNRRPGTIGMTDNGPDAATSMHTMHTDVNEIDPNTTAGGGLNTVPDGEIASIRLGAYTGSGQSARIEYKYRVQAGMSDLLDLKYAAVLNSGNHGSEEAYFSGQSSDMNPTFRLDVLDSRGNQIAGCTHFDFCAGFGDQTAWHQEDDIFWSDWQTVTVSLRQYVGQTLTIRLTATRCSYDTHFAYAYFTLGCRNGGLEGVACGDFTTDHFTAPEGFSYRWYKEGYPTQTLGTEQTFNIDPHSSDIYIVECHNLVDPTCYYALTANPNPHYPMASAEYNVTSADCQNTVTFINSSMEHIVDRSTGQQMAGTVAEPLYDFIIDYGDGTEPEAHTAQSVTHEYPTTGGTFQARFSASINDGICVDDTVFTITLPDLIHTASADSVHFCANESFVIPTTGEVVHSDTVYTTYTTNKYGCQAPSDHHVFFHATSYDSTVVELCEGGYVDFEGKRYMESGRYTVNLNTVHGCDSVLELMLTVIPRLEFAAPDTIDICADDEFISIPYEVFKGRVSAVNVYFDEEGQKKGFLPQYGFDKDSLIKVPTPKHLKPGYYPMSLSLGTPDCPSDPVSIVLRVRYASSVIDQKNDLVALLNSNYNGGYSWIRYQWYRNDVLLPWATTSYVVVSDADQGSEYYCVVTDPDGNTMATCPIVYTSARTALDDLPLLSVHPTIARPGENLYLSQGGAISIFDALGREVLTQFTDPSASAVVAAPSQAGVYIIRVGSSAARILVK